MTYKHQYFVLDTESRRVFDENDKPLRLTGNAFRLLIFLCSRKNATITDIGEELDSAKDYDENNVRQYKYKINTIIGHDIIEYRNGIYSIIGGIEQVENMRNTSLLRSDSTQSREIMKKQKDIKFYIIPGIIAIIFLLSSFFNWSYSFYTLLRLVVTAVAVYYAYYLYQSLKKKDFWFWALVVVAVIFNPLVPIYIYNKSTWGIIDVVVAIFFGITIIKFKKK